MKIQKYVARDMPEAMKKIRAELGNDAVILHSKVIYTGGFLGLFKKEISKYSQPLIRAFQRQQFLSKQKSEKCAVLF
ncbi:hypothetical protein [Niallia circulans]|uniref:hypothetical protein n=1 Tax=Niallia circulans TaxID=1397 RepID=UPI0026CF52DD